MLPMLLALIMAGTPLPFAELVATTTPQDLWIEKLIDCESGGNEKVKVWDTNNQWSFGLLQFQMKTWLAYGKKFGATKENIYDPDLQQKVAKYMLDKDLWKHWFTCGKLVQKSLGKYPVSSD